MTNTTPQKSPYRIDLKLILIHVFLLLGSYLTYKNFAYVPEQKDMSALFFMIISVLGGIIGVIILAVALRRLDHSIQNLALYKFFLTFTYWISSTLIFIMLGSSKFFYNEPMVMLVFILLFFASLYFSVLKVANMRKKDYVILIAITLVFILFNFFLKI